MVLALFLVGCGETSKQDVQKSEPKQVVVEEVKAETPKIEEVKEVVKEVVVEVEKVVKEVVTQELAKIIDAKAIFTACAGCHGKSGEKIALGKSKIIQAWSVEKLTNALNGYKDGTYGGAMKGLMKGQVSKLNADEIKAVSEYISKL
ncbi:MAG: c-type cytochrome [Sulfurimonas sp.]|nr:c-type cytochrome [Sulfurimonas sp.]